MTSGPEQAGPSRPRNPPRTTSRIQDITEEKPPFGSRFLTEDADVWSQNAWDHVPPPEDQGEVIANALAKQHIAPVPEEERQKYNEKPARHWDNFYKMNAGNFFRNRKWLHHEFPELLQSAEPDAGPVAIAELGCGAGNAVFPLLAANKNPQLSLYAYDYASHAVKVVQSNPLYLEPPVGTIKSAVWDLSSDSLPPDLAPNSIDIVTLVFVLSALHPREWSQAIVNIHRILKPGGLVLFRDYGRYDLTQLRFKGGRLLEDNFYIRGDKTRVYFFELDELALLFTGSLAPTAVKNAPSEVKVEEEGDESETPPHTEPSTRVQSPQASETPSPRASTPITINAETQPSSTPPPKANGTSTSKTVQSTIHPILHPLLEKDTQSPHPLFSMEQLGVDRRLIVNRKRQLKMYRVWMQGKFRKLEPKADV
ncbi:unnamed protein product [Somion occarium]|uniref:tRNA N(3)-methylcytidine methyltransferase n=1 Tax=Somion occarium TaxID=3059160 RepID=A0ABP1E357_9APHY